MGKSCKFSIFGASPLLGATLCYVAAAFVVHGWVKMMPLKDLKSAKTPLNALGEPVEPTRPRPSIAIPPVYRLKTREG
jgi:uncharacterized membrane protein YphA (DoxX/SURF4 family)